MTNNYQAEYEAANARRAGALARQIERVKANPEASPIACEGIRAAAAGEPVTACPYGDGHGAAVWKIGHEHGTRNPGAPARKHDTEAMRRAGRYQVNLLAAGMPLVRAGGNGLDDLREDAYDAARSSNGRAGVHDICATYVSAMMGGEPFAVWN